MFAKIMGALGKKNKVITIFVKKGIQETPIQCQVGTQQLM